MRAFRLHRFSDQQRVCFEVECQTDLSRCRESIQGDWGENPGSKSGGFALDSHPNGVSKVREEFMPCPCRTW